MGRALKVLLFCFFAATLPAEEPQVVNLILQDRAWFTDRVAVAVAWFDAVVAQPEDWARESEDCRILDIEVSETPTAKEGKSAAIIRFLPTKTGLVTVPSQVFNAGETTYQSAPIQIRVGEPLRSPAMSLTLTPAKKSVYVGEPLRVELAWDCALPAGALRSLRLHPAFFNEKEVEVVIPRNTSVEDRQVGLPIGGRRAIATRTPSAEGAEDLGRVELPLYLRFSHPGTYTLPETRLECAYLSGDRIAFSRYAAYFNNGLFELVDTGANYDRIYTLAAPQSIEVLPLPAAEQRPDFSGLFEPIDLEASIQPTEVEIGQLMELEINVRGDTPHGMLELPPLSRQPGLRARFLVDNTFERRWQEHGTIFRARLRALTTTVHALPSLQFQVFDPAEGVFRMVSTKPIPLVVKPGNGQDFIALNSYEGASVRLTDQPEGIWNNLEVNRMNELSNTLILLVQRGFPVLLLAGPLAFLALLPWVRERRRRALDPGYRARVLALAELRNLPAGAPGKWPAFLRFLAASFGASDRAWTVGDSREALRSIGATDSEIEQVAALHQAADARDFSAARPVAQFADLDALGRRVMRLLARSSMLWIAAWLLASPAARADEWSEAESAFQQALDTPAGSEASPAAYARAALKFQAAAEAGSRSGQAWVNAGNAWFQAGAIGRSIADYLRAREFRPFDQKLAANLAAARALVANEVPAHPAFWKVISAPWLKLALVVANLVFWGVLLMTLRYRRRPWILTAVSCGLVLAVVTGLYLANLFTARTAGVIIVDATEARKGPGYAYASAFDNPLHDGLELSRVEARGNWGRVELPDTRQCWVPISSVEWIND